MFQCFTPENLLSIHSINQKTGMNQTQFKDLCPSLIQQIEGGTCKKPVVKKAAKTKEQGWKRKFCLFLLSAKKSFYTTIFKTKSCERNLQTTSAATSIRSNTIKIPFDTIKYERTLPQNAQTYS